MRHLKLEDAKAKLCQQAGLLGEPCDPEILIQHYGKLGATVHSEAGMDLKSESAAIYVMVVATLYLVMVAVMVGLNYRLRGRYLPRPRATHCKEEEAVEEEVKMEVEKKVEEATEEKSDVRRGVSVCFTEGRAAYTVLDSKREQQSRVDL